MRAGKPGGRGSTVRVLVTGAGGPAAIAAMRSLSADPDIELFAADMDPWAAGLYLVPPGRRTIIPPGDADGFAESLLARCVQLGTDVLLPTVDAELEPVARAADAYADAGISLLLAPAPALGVILDKLLLARRCAGVVPRPAHRTVRPAARSGRLGLPGDRQAAPWQRFSRRPHHRVPGRAGRA